VRGEIDQIKRACVEQNQGRAVYIDNLHLTLRFLGGVKDEQLASISSAVMEIDAAPFSIELDCFGHWEHPRALWIGPQITPVPLLALQRRLEQVLEEECNIDPEQSPYRPHVTLMRKVKRVDHLPHFAPFQWNVSQFSLMESVSTVEGVQYHVLKRWNLG